MFYSTFPVIRWAWGGNPSRLLSLAPRRHCFFLPSRRRLVECDSAFVVILAWIISSSTGVSDASVRALFVQGYSHGMWIAVENWNLSGQSCRIRWPKEISRGNDYTMLHAWALAYFLRRHGNGFTKFWISEKAWLLIKLAGSQSLDFESKESLHPLLASLVWAILFPHSLKFGVLFL